MSAYMSLLPTLPKDASTFSTLRQTRNLPFREISTTYNEFACAQALAWAVLLVNGGSHYVQNFNH